MEIGEKQMAVVFSFVAVMGIALLFLLSETPKKSSVAEALLAEPNTLVEVAGAAANVTPEKFMLCERLCVSIKTRAIPSAALLFEGRSAIVLGRVKEYQGNRYLEAEKITLG
jgi:hypothetical protein